MNIEQIEFQLTQLDGKSVVFIIPSFGKVSFSYIGILNAVHHPESHDVGFHASICNGSSAIIFFAIDVDKITPPDDANKNVEKIVYLKGPHMPSIAETWKDA